MQPKYLEDSDPLIFIEECPDMDLVLSYFYVPTLVNRLHETAGRNGKRMAVTQEGYFVKLYLGEKDSFELGEHVLQRIIADPSFGKQINENITRYADRLKADCLELDLKNLHEYSSEELLDHYERICETHVTLYTWGWLSNITDMVHGNFTNYLKSILESKLPEDRVNWAMVVLSASPAKTVVSREHESFLKLVALKEKGVPENQLEEAVHKHVAEFFYLKHLWIGKYGVYDYDYYVNEIDKFLASSESAGELLQKEEKLLAETLAEREKLIEELHLDESTKIIFNVYADFAITKLQRRDAQIFWAYTMTQFYKEIGRRFNINPEFCRFMLPNEIMDGLKNDGFDEALLEEVRERMKFAVHYVEEGLDKIYIGEEAQRIKSYLKEQEVTDITELKGHTACLGKATGTVRIINEQSQMSKMNEGDILVSIITNPDIVPAMKKAAAIVTDVGGITSHAAIVSRELNTPCIIGTKIATKVLKDGDLVEVDASKGVVRILEKA